MDACLRRHDRIFDNADPRVISLFYCIKYKIETFHLFFEFKFAHDYGAKDRFEGDKIYTFKPQSHRFLCFFFTGGKIIVTNAFHKKTSKLPSNEKKRALKYKDDYELRVKRGEYYE